MGKILSWGQNQVTLTPLGSGGTASVYKSIVQNSTKLETTEGEVTDAVIEGGEIEASRRAKSSYNLTFQVRIGGGDDTSNTDNIKDSDGVVDGEFSAEVKCTEATGAPTVKIARCTVSVSTSYTSADGIIKPFTCRALKPATGKMVDIGNGAE